MKNSTRILSFVLAIVLLFTAIPFSASAKTLAEFDAEIEKYEKEIAGFTVGGCYDYFVYNCCMDDIH